MSTEAREGQDQERGKKSVAGEIYREIVRRIKELLRIPEQDQTDEQKKELKDLQTTRRANKRLFRAKAPRYAPQFDQLIEEARRDIGQAIEVARNASAADKPAKAATVSDFIRAYRKEAAELGREEPNLPADLQRIGQTDLEEEIDSLEEKNRSILAITAKPNESPEGNEENDKTLQALIRNFMKTGETREVAEQHAKEQLSNILRPRPPSSGEFSMYGYSKEDLDKIRDESDGFDEFREEKFDELFIAVDARRAQNFHEALSSQDTLIKLDQFFRALARMKTRKGTDLIDEYVTKYRLRMSLHNAGYVVEFGGGKPEQLSQMMEQFSPELFDQLFRYEGVSTAAHLYEMGVETLRARNDNYSPYEDMASNPKLATERNKLDEWVRARLIEALRITYGEEKFNNKWTEQKIRRTLALAKGYEIATIRMPELVARGRLPKGPAAMKGPWGEDFARPLDPFEHLIEKFLTGDPGAQWLLYTVTDGAIKPNFGQEQLDAYFKDAKVDPAKLRMIDIVNFFEIGGPFTQSSWRGLVGMEDLSPEDKKWMGLTFNLAMVEDKYKEPKKKAKNDPKKKEELEALEQKEIRALFEQALDRNPVRILREAELQDGEILDFDVQAAVIERTLRQFYSGPELEAEINKLAARRNENESQEDFAKRVKAAKKEREVFFTKAEEPLITLAQIGVEKREDRINLDHIADPEKRKYPQAYADAIREVVNDPNWKRKWLKQYGVVEENKGIGRAIGILHNEKPLKQAEREGTLMDYLCEKVFPFSSGFDDVPWEKLDFIKMGQKGFSRRLRDYYGATKAMNSLIKLENSFGRITKPQDIVGALDETVQAIREYDKNKAKEKVMKLYEGIMKFNSADKVKRWLPFPFNAGWEFLCNSRWFGLKPTSAAREAFGYKAASYYGIDLYNFLGYARSAGHLTQEQETVLRKKLQCDVGNLFWEYSRRGWLIGGLFIINLWVEEALKQIQEETKQH